MGIDFSHTSIRMDGCGKKLLRLTKEIISASYQQQILSIKTRYLENHEVSKLMDIIRKMRLASKSVTDT